MLNLKWGGGCYKTPSRPHFHPPLFLYSPFSPPVSRLGASTAYCLFCSGCVLLTVSSYQNAIITWRSDYAHGTSARSNSSIHLHKKCTDTSYNCQLQWLNLGSDDSGFKTLCYFWVALLQFLNLC